MIKKLRVRFIRIATVSAAAVLLLLCLIVNIAHFATVNGDLTDMLVMIAQNRGRADQRAVFGVAKHKIAGRVGCTLLPPGD